MARVIAYRIGIAILALIAFCLLWSLAYEIIVGLRWAPSRFPSEGSTRWALLRAQNADRSAGSLLIAWQHLHSRLLYPPTRMETLIRAGFAVATVGGLAIAVFIVAMVNRRQMPYGAARFGTLMEAAKQGLTGDCPGFCVRGHSDADGGRIWSSRRTHWISCLLGVIHGLFSPRMGLSTS